jgi:hypothetical protein
MADSLDAREILVESPGQFASALKTARAGDTVTLKDGSWNDVKIVVNRGGELDNPVVIRAETPGGVKLGGASSLEIAAAHVTVDGFWFHGGAITKGARGTLTLKDEVVSIVLSSVSNKNATAVVRLPPHKFTGNLVVKINAN